MKKLLRHPLTVKILAAILAAYIWLVFHTARVRIVTPVPAALAQGPVVLASWHQQVAFLPVFASMSASPLMALMSSSRDGIFIRLIAAWFGIRAAVGSSHRGAVAGARAMVQAARSGYALYITPDGPRGPSCIAKDGATEIARLTKLPLVPCAVWCSRGKTFRSWDKFLLPYPFATITIAYAEPLQNLTPQALQDILNTLTAQAQATIAPLASNRRSH